LKVAPFDRLCTVSY